jgi:RimJ/RimL family protein N-acetyltransferase
MEYREFIKEIFDSYKCKSKIDEYRTIAIYDMEELVGFLKPLTYLYKIVRPIYVNLICQWRQENEIGFANRFKNTYDKTKNWIDNIYLPREDRILFMVHNLDNTPIGHLGFSSFDFETKSCEIDNVVRGVKGINNGLMTLATITLIDWGKRVLNLKDVYLRVLADNSHAIRFYEMMEFKTVENIPLYKRETEDFLEWIEEGDGEPDRFHLLMKLCQDE